MIPSSYLTRDAEAVSVNGSSATGHCSSASITNMGGVLSTCSNTTSGVLFDGVIPTLTGLDGDMWASQLLTLRATSVGPLVAFHFTETPGYAGLSGRIEMVMFNCPQYGISAGALTVATSSVSSGPFTTLLNGVNIGITSCDSLVRVCRPIATADTIILIQYFFGSGSGWVHLAEVTFYADSSASTCPPDTVVTPGSITTPPTSAVTIAPPTSDVTMAPPTSDVTMAPLTPDVTTPDGNAFHVQK